MFTQLLKVPVSVSQTAVRSFGQHNKKHIYKDGQKFANNFYYPRQPNHVDEPFEPAKLFRVQRIKPAKGNPFWEQRILKQFGIADERGPRVTIVKNIPETNAMLWKVKHLVHIVPIHFPYGEPNASDVAYTHLKESGECVVTKEIAIDERRLDAAVEFDQRPDRLDGETLRKDSRLKWLNHW